jgi:hypothetical protein
MKIFKLISDCEFEAENLDAAFGLLSEHFEFMISNDEVETPEDPFPMVGGSMSLKVIKEV